MKTRTLSGRCLCPGVPDFSDVGFVPCSPKVGRALLKNTSGSLSPPSRWICTGCSELACRPPAQSWAVPSCRNTSSVLHLPSRCFCKGHHIHHLAGFAQGTMGRLCALQSKGRSHFAAVAPRAQLTTFTILLDLHRAQCVVLEPASPKKGRTLLQKHKRRLPIFDPTSAIDSP
jgi:hypothetical protein